MRTMYIAHKSNGVIGVLTGTNKEITDLYMTLTSNMSAWNIITRSQYEKKSAAIDKAVATAKAAVAND